ncbi:MAG: nucleotide exchange factor GrpE [Buchnera aphidicola (Meitanaphis microgallis)]
MMDINEKLLNQDNIATNIDSKNDASKLENDPDIKQVNVLKKIISDLEADFLNQKALSQERLKLYRDRIQKDVNNALKFSLNNFINSLLPTIDNIERALGVFDEKDEHVKSIFYELKVILRSFMKLFKKFGLIVIDESNVPFNPDIHQAMIIKSSSDKQKNCVISIIQKGYLLNGRLLRPAMVIVSKP